VRAWEILEEVGGGSETERLGRVLRTLGEFDPLLKTRRLGRRSQRQSELLRLEWLVRGESEREGC